MDSFWTEKSTLIVLAVVAAMVVMRLLLPLVPRGSAAARLILYFWHPDARRRGPLDEQLHPQTIANMDSTLLALAVVFFVIRPVLLQAFYIPSASMEPTLYGERDGRKDRVLVNKYIFRLRAPRRGEILVFKAPQAAHPSTPGRQDYIKRLVGMPGDVLEVKNHRAFINGQRLEEPYLPDVSAADMRWADFGPVTIPPDCYFMMGDNRGNSSDSRVWGPLPVKDVLGKAVCVFWPIVARKPDQPETGLHWGWKLLR